MATDVVVAADETAVDVAQHQYLVVLAQSQNPQGFDVEDTLPVAGAGKKCLVLRKVKIRLVKQHANGTLIAMTVVNH